MAGYDWETNSRDGTRLRGYSSLPSGPLRAVILFIHGFAEYAGRYDEFSKYLAEYGYAFYCVDLRGHGGSAGKRGFIQSYADYLSDVDAAYQYMLRKHPGQTFILGSHSNGGLTAARYLSTKERHAGFRGVFFSSPFMGLSMPVSWFKRGLAFAVSAIAPGLALPSNIDPSWVSHDEDVCEAYRSDPLIFRTATARWFTETLKEQALAIAEAPGITLPTAVFQGMEDYIASVKDSRLFFDSLGSAQKEWLGYDGFYHEILNEKERSRVYKDILRFLDRLIA